MQRQRHERAHATTGAVAGDVPTTTTAATPSLEQLIVDGAFDHRLPALTDAINHRLRAIDDAESAAARQRLHVGDRVRHNDRVKPRYLEGQAGTIHEIHDDYIVVCLDQPIGRFTSRHVRSHPRTLEPITESQQNPTG